MRIAIVINTSWNIFNFRKGLIEGLKKDGHDLYAIAPKDDYSHKLKDLDVTFVPVNMDNKGTNPIKDSILIRDLRNIYRTNKIDVALHYTIKPNIYGAIACEGINTLAINNVSGLGTAFIRENLVTKVARLLYKFALKRSFFVFFQNKDDKTLFQELGLVKSTNVGLLPGSGIPLDLLKFSQKDYVDNSKVFLLPCRLLIDKGVGEFVQAARKLKAKYNDQVSFLLCGKPEDNPKLGFSKKNALEWQSEGLIKYLGHIDNVEDYIFSSDCVVLPSYREGTPRVLLEAASIGRPIVTTDAPGCREVVQDNVNGYLCKTKDVNSLYNCMLQIINLDNESLQVMAQNGRNIIENKFDENIVVDKYRDIINTI